MLPIAVYRSMSMLFPAFLALGSGGGVGSVVVAVPMLYLSVIFRFLSFALQL